MSSPSAAYSSMCVQTRRSDNAIVENSADFHLRVYTIRPKFIQLGTPGGINSGNIQIEGLIELHDPDRLMPFTITNHFTEQRLLTGADFDIDSMQRARHGTPWFGDELGPS
jgi:glycerophosphoryl diester phosphodiesterase